MRSRAALLLILLLLSGCAGARPSGKSSEAPLVAAFEASPELPRVGEEVRFEDRSQGAPESWQWDFGDGEKSTERSPTHSYARQGLYEVRLVVAAGGRQDSASRFLQVGEAGGKGGFSIDFRHQVDGLTVEFEPRPQPATAVVEASYWEFGDGEVSRQSAPTHTYAEPGRYTVKLRAISGGSLANATHVVSLGQPAGPDGPLSLESFAVIAIIDTGINPYHEEFEDPAFDAHPATYVEGFPEAAQELRLSLLEPDFDDALKRDANTWKAVKSKTLYWIPGTRVVGAISFDNPGQRRILDDHNVAEANIGHGTLTASDAAGATLGSCPECLLVVIEAGSAASFQEGLEWAMSQPWIDAISNSWGLCLLTCDADTAFLPAAVADSRTKAAVERGQEIFFASGNGVLNRFESPQLTYWNAYTGPDWIVTVGASDAQTGAAVVGTGRPVDIVAPGLDVKGASHTSTSSITTWSGTSASSPFAAGAYSFVLQGARRALGDVKEGPHGGVAVGAAAKGLLADGKLTRHEAERALFVTASTAAGTGPLVPPTLPQSAAGFAYRGYGIVSSATAKEALKVVVGERAAPDRATEDQWAAIDSRIRRAIWGEWNSGGGDLAPPEDESLSLWQTMLGLADP